MIDRYADELFRAWRDVTPIPPLAARSPELAVEQAYEIQKRWIGRREQTGARRVGRKVGLTSVAMQELLGVRQPDFGSILDEMIVGSGGIDSATLVAPRVEPEIAFRLEAPLAGDVSVDDVLAATEAVIPVLEIVDSRIEDWRITIVDTVADNASSALVVLGPTAVPVGEIDLVAETVTMRVGGEEVSGRGSDVLGHPAAAVSCLVKLLAARGERLEPGDIVLPGAMTRALPIAAGDQVRAAFSSLGGVGVSVY